METYEKTMPNENEPFDVLDFLEKLGDVSERDIMEFGEKRVLPDRRDFFDKFSRENQMRVVAIDALPPKELAKLKKSAQEKNPTYALGTHNIRGLLLDLNNLTEDEKYDY